MVLWRRLVNFSESIPAHRQWFLKMAGNKLADHLLEIFVLTCVYTIGNHTPYGKISA